MAQILLIDKELQMIFQTSDVSSCNGNIKDPIYCVLQKNKNTNKQTNKQNKKQTNKTKKNPKIYQQYCAIDFSSPPPPNFPCFSHFSPIFGKFFAVKGGNLTPLTPVTMPLSLPHYIISRKRMNFIFIYISVRFSQSFSNFFHSFSFKEQFNFVPKNVLEQKSISISNLCQAISKLCHYISNLFH